MRNGQSLAPKNRRMAAAMATNANPNQPCPKCGAALPRADANELVATINGRRVCEDPVACYERAGGDHNPDGHACYQLTIDLRERR